MKKPAMKKNAALIALWLCSCSTDSLTSSTPTDDPEKPEATNPVLQVGGQLYAVDNAQSGGNAVLWRVGADGSRSDPLDIGPVSGPMVDAESMWGWLWIADGHTVFKASLDPPSGRWSLARRVWTTADPATTISSLESTADRLLVRTTAGTEALSERDLDFRACGDSIPPDYGYEVGRTYTHRGFIDFIPGSLPLILSSPHNGTIVPDGWITDPDMLIRDGGSLAFLLALADELEGLTGERPSVVINNVQRNVLNLNLAWTAEPNFGNPEAETAWNAFHDFIDAQKSAVSSVCGQGVYIDVHTSALSHHKSTLGYLLTTEEINLPDPHLDLLVERSSLRGLMASDAGFRLSQAVRGPLSLGGLLNEAGYSFLPSPFEPIPIRVVGGSTQYFNGGYNTRHHGSHLDGGPVDGIQIESDWTYINNGTSGVDGQAVRQKYAKHVAEKLVEYMERWYGFLLRD